MPIFERIRHNGKKANAKTGESVPLQNSCRAAENFYLDDEQDPGRTGKFIPDSAVFSRRKPPLESSLSEPKGEAGVSGIQRLSVAGKEIISPEKIHIIDRDVKADSRIVPVPSQIDAIDGIAAASAELR